MATFELFGQLRAEANARGDVWLHGAGSEAGVRIRFTATSPAHASRIGASVNGEAGERDTRLPPARRGDLDARVAAPE